MVMKLVIGCVLSGVVLGLTTIYVLTGPWEILLWALLAGSIGFVVAKSHRTRVFLNGFWYAVLAGVCSTLTHITLIGDYLATHHDEKELMENMGLTASHRLTLLGIAPIYWMSLGLLSGLSSIVWLKIRKKPSAKP
jgi:hypothetical protein